MFFFLVSPIQVVDGHRIWPRWWDLVYMDSKVLCSRECGDFDQALCVCSSKTGAKLRRILNEQGGGVPLDIRQMNAVGGFWWPPIPADEDHTEPLYEGLDAVKLAKEFGYRA